MNQAQVRYNAQNRYNQYYNQLLKSELTIVHYPPGADYCSTDPKEAIEEKKTLAKQIACACIDAEINGHSLVWTMVHTRKIDRLLEEKKVIQSL